MLALMTINGSKESAEIEETEKVKMKGADLTNWLAVAETAVGKGCELVEHLWEQAEDENTQCAAVEKECDGQQRRINNNPELVVLKG